MRKTLTYKNGRVEMTNEKDITISVTCREDLRGLSPSFGDYVWELAQVYKKHMDSLTTKERRPEGKLGIELSLVERTIPTE